MHTDPRGAGPDPRAPAKAPLRPDERAHGRQRRKLAMLLRRVSRRAPERLWHWLDTAPLRPLAPFVAPVLRKLDRTRWQRAWSWEREQPESELASVVPRELVEAVERGWVPPDSAVMDVGAGAGQIAAWLAERGFRVFGPDLSAEATALATRRYPHLRERIEFRTLDLCTAPPVPGRFDWIVDRGCFHVIPEALAPRYVANLATWAKPRAKLLLFSRKGRVDSVPHFFAPHFEIVRTAPYLYTRSAGPRPQQTSQGKVFWMVRR